MKTSLTKWLLIVVAAGTFSLVLLLCFLKPDGMMYVDYQDLPSGGVSISHYRGLSDALISVSLIASFFFLLIGSLLGAIRKWSHPLFARLSGILVGIGVAFAVWHLAWTKVFDVHRSTAKSVKVDVELDQPN